MFYLEENVVDCYKLKDIDSSGRFESLEVESLSGMAILVSGNKFVQGIIVLDAGCSRGSRLH